MEPYPHLSKAPIVEAVIDIRVKLPAEFDMSALVPLREKLTENYPQVQELSDFQLSTEWKPGAEPRASTQIGSVSVHLFQSRDRKQVIQFRRDGFSFSRLSPYTSWEEMFADAWEMWTLYVEVAKPVEISRLAVRYINKMALPGPDLNIYMKTGPVLADGWPSDMAAFVERLVLLDLENQITINIVHLMEPQTDPAQTTFPVIFDIDAFQDLALSATDVTIRERFSKLRQTKNRIFFEAITRDAVELFL